MIRKKILIFNTGSVEHAEYIFVVYIFVINFSNSHGREGVGEAKNTMAPNDTRRPYKRPAISDQQRRREISLRRQEQNRHEAQLQARRLATTFFSLPSQTAEETSVPPDIELVSEPQPDSQREIESGSSPTDLHDFDFDVRDASKLKGPEARKWFARQLMLPEWMIDVPDRLPHDWLAFLLIYIGFFFLSFHFS